MKRISTWSRCWLVCHGLVFAACEGPRDRDPSLLPDTHSDGPGGPIDSPPASAGESAPPDGTPGPAPLDATATFDSTTAPPVPDAELGDADVGGRIADASGPPPEVDASDLLPAPVGPSGPLDDCRLGPAFDFNAAMTLRDDGVVIAEIPLGLQIFEPPCDSTGASALVAFVAPTDGWYSVGASPLAGEPAAEFEFVLLDDCRLPVQGSSCLRLPQDEPLDTGWWDRSLGPMHAGQRAYFVIGSDAPVGTRVALRVGRLPTERSEGESCGGDGRCRPPLICQHDAEEDESFCAAAAPPVVTGVRAQYLASTRSVYVRYAGTVIEGSSLEVEVWAYDDVHEWRTPGISKSASGWAPPWAWVPPVMHDGNFEGELIIDNLGFEPTGIQLRAVNWSVGPDGAMTVTAPVVRIDSDPRQPDGAPCAQEGGIFECRPGVACRRNPEGGPELTCQPPPPCARGVLSPAPGRAGPWEIPAGQGFEAPAEGIYSVTTDCYGHVRLGCPDIDSPGYELGRQSSHRATFHLDRGERVFPECEPPEFEVTPPIQCHAFVARPNPSLPTLLEAQLFRAGRGRAAVRVRGVATEHRVARIDATWIDAAGDLIPGVSPVSHQLDYEVAAGPFDISGLEFGLPAALPAEARLRLTARDFFDQASETLVVAFEDFQPVAEDELENVSYEMNTELFFEGDMIRGRAVGVSNQWLPSDLVGLEIDFRDAERLLPIVEPVARDLGAQCTPNPDRAPCVAGLDCASPDGAQAPVCLPAAMECPPEWNEVELAPPPPHGRSRVRERIWRDGWRGGAPCEPVLTHGDVYGFTAPEAGSYLFNLQTEAGSDVTLFARSRCTATPPEPILGCDTGALLYNRMVRLSLAAGERAHLFVVGEDLAETGIPYTLWVEGPTPAE